MSLYTAGHFAGRDPADARALMLAYPFATLVTTSGGEPHITHLPLLLEDEWLTGHMARANPHWQAFAAGHTVAIFHGPHAYITPNWYVDPAGNVPTWNYATVHVQGRPQLLDTPDARLAVVDRTTAQFENPAAPWRRQLEGARLDAMLGNIVAFHIPIEKLEAKFKMNQNRTAADRGQVIAKLRESGHPDLIAMAEWMKTHEPA